MIEVIHNHYEFNKNVFGYVVKKDYKYWLVSIQRFPNDRRVEIYPIVRITKYLFKGIDYDADFREAVYVDKPGSLGKALDFIEENL